VLEVLEDVLGVLELLECLRRILKGVENCAMLLSTVGDVLCTEVLEVVLEVLEVVPKVLEVMLKVPEIVLKVSEIVLGSAEGIKGYTERAGDCALFAGCSEWCAMPIAAPCSTYCPVLYCYSVLPLCMLLCTLLSVLEPWSASSFLLEVLEWCAMCRALRAVRAGSCALC